MCIRDSLKESLQQKQSGASACFWVLPPFPIVFLSPVALSIFVLPEFWNNFSGPVACFWVLPPFPILFARVASLPFFLHCCSKAQPQSFSCLASRTSPSKHTAARKRSTSKFLVSRFLHTLSLKNQSGSSSGPEKFVPKLWETFSNKVQQHVDHVRATSNLPFLLLGFRTVFEPGTEANSTVHKH